MCSAGSTTLRVSLTTEGVVVTVCYNLDFEGRDIAYRVVLSSWLIEWVLLFDCLLHVYCTHT